MQTSISRSNLRSIEDSRKGNEHDQEVDALTDAELDQLGAILAQVEAMCAEAIARIDAASARAAARRVQ